MIYNLISSEVILLVGVYEVVNCICPVGSEEEKNVYATNRKHVSFQ
jgi:hypothetical protein